MPKKIQKIVSLCIWSWFVLAGCTPIHSTQTLETSPTTPLATSLPAPQASELGALGKGMVSDVAWLPDEKLFAVRSSSGIYFHDTQTWQVVKTISENELKDKSAAGLTFTPDEKELVLSVWSNPSTFWYYDLQSGTTRLWFEDASLNYPSAPVFSPDGKSFVITNGVCEKTGNGVQICSSMLELRDSVDGKLRYSLQKGSFDQYNEITAFVFSPNGKQLAVASEDNLVRVWDTINGKLLYEFHHDSNAMDVAYSPDGRVLASASMDATVRFWDAQTGRNLATLRDFKQGTQRVAYLDQGKKLLVGQIYANTFQEYALDDRTLPVAPLDIDMEVGKKQNQYWAVNSATARTFISPDTHKMAVLLNDTVQIWNLDSGKPILTLPEYNSQIFNLTFSPDGNLLAAADHDIRLWDVPAQKWLSVLPINAYEVQDSVFSPDGKNLAIAADGNLTLWDTTTFQKLLEIKTQYGIENIAYAHDGKQLAMAGKGHIQILNAKTGRVLQQFITRDDGYSLALNFSADGKQLFYAGSIERLGWDLASNKPLYSIHTEPDYYGKAAIASNLGVFWQWDSYHRYFDAKSNPQWNNSFHFFDPATGQGLYDLANPDDSQYIIAALSSNGRLLAWYRNGKIDLLDAASGQVLTSISFDNLLRLSLSPDSRTLAATSYDGTIHLWDISSVKKRIENILPQTATPAPSPVPTSTATPETLPTLDLQSLSQPGLDINAIRPENVAQLKVLNELGFVRPTAAAFSADGNMLAIGGSSGAYTFEFGSQQPSHFLPADEFLNLLAFSPDGRLLAGQMSNSAIQVWDATTGDDLYRLEDIGCWNDGMQFSPDHQVLSADCGNVTYHWSMADGTLLGKDTEKISLSGLSPNGNMDLLVGMASAELIDSHSQKVIKTFDVPGMAPAFARFSPDGKTLLIWFYEYEVARSGVYVPGKDFKSLIQLWNILPNREPVLRITLNAGKWYQDLVLLGAFQGLAFTPDSRRVASASGDGTVQIWDTISGKLLASLPDGRSIYFSPDGTRLISLGNFVQIWDTSPGRQPSILWNIPGFSDFQSLLTLAENGSEMVTAKAGVFHFWARNGESFSKQPTVIQAPDVNMNLPAVSPDGKWLAYSTDIGLMLGENNSKNPKWQVLEKFSDQPFPVGTEAVVFSPDSSLLAVIDADRKILLWRLDNLDAGPVELAREIFVDSLIFSPDSKSVLGVSGGSTEEQPLYIWDTQTGKLLSTWKTMGYQFAFHPSGEVLAVSEYVSGKISLFDLRSQNILQEMDGQHYIREITFSPDGRLLVTGGEKGMEFWDVPTGKLLKTMEGSFNRIIFTPDGKDLIISLSDGRIQVWGVSEK